MEMSEGGKGPKRGLLYSCNICDVKGERYRVAEHIFEAHLTPDDWPYICPICEYAHFNYTNFTKHVKWYVPHKMMMKKANSLELPVKENVQPKSKVVYSMMSKLSQEDSIKYWASRKRSSSQISNADTNKEKEIPQAVTEPPASKFRKIAPKPTLNVTEKLLLEEFLTFDSHSNIELDYEYDAHVEEEFTERQTADKSTMTEDGELEIARKRMLTQEREIERLRRIMVENGLDPDEGQKLVHKGLGEGENSKIYKENRAPIKQMKSVIYKMPRQRMEGRRQERESTDRKRREWESLFKGDKFRL